jgi:hypothetical protein
MAARKKSKAKKTAPRSGAKPAGKKKQPKRAAAKKPARPAAKSTKAATGGAAPADVVYTDIRRSLHGAILRNLR